MGLLTTGSILYSTDNVSAVTTPTFSTFSRAAEIPAALEIVPSPVIDTKSSELVAGGVRFPADDRHGAEKGRPLLRSGGRFAGPEHDDFRADRCAVVEIDDILVRQADAARRNVGADGPGFIGAVDAV
jgi:hypothetical protein